MSPAAATTEAAIPVPPRRPRRRWWRLALLALLLLALWASGLPGLLVHAVAMRSAAADWRDRGLWLPDYEAEIGGVAIEGLGENVSGLTFSRATGTLFTAINRPSELAELSPDGRLLRRIALHGAQDVEGITHVGGSTFILADEGTARLSWVEITPQTRRIDLAAAPFLLLDLDAFWNKGFEGISWDHRRNRLILAQEMWPARVMIVEGLDRALAGEGLRITVREWKPAPLTGHFLADLSSVTLHEATGNFLLLSHMTSALAEYAPDGAPVSLMPLWKGWHGLERKIPQAEGVAIGPDGDIYIVSEPNLFYRLGRERRAGWTEGG